MQFEDQLGRAVQLDAVPKRIVSTVPSQSEFIFDLGLKEALVGITKFCIHPEEKWRSTERIGGTKNLNLDKIRALNPDLIIANKEENTRDQIEALAKEFPVWISDVKNLPEAFDMMTQVGLILDKEEEAQKIRNRTEQKWQTLKGAAKEMNVAYCIWNDPLMFAGEATFIDAVLSWLGFSNVVRKWEGRYPEITLKELESADPGIVFLSSEPFPFSEKHQLLFQSRTANISGGFPLVNGEMFSWYGSRLDLAAAYLQQLLNELNLKTS